MGKNDDGTTNVQVRVPAVCVSHWTTEIFNINDIIIFMHYANRCAPLYLYSVQRCVMPKCLRMIYRWHSITLRGFYFSHGDSGGTVR